MHPPSKAFILGTPSPLKHLFVLVSWQRDLSSVDTLFPASARDSRVLSTIRLISRMLAVASYNSKHTQSPCLPHLPSATYPPYGTRSHSRIPPAYSTCQGRQASQSEATGPTSAPSDSSQISVVGLGHVVWRNGMMLQLQLSFAAPCCRAAPILIRSFLVLPVPTYRRFRTLVLAQMTDGPPRSTSSCASAPPDPSPSHPSLSCLLPNSLRHCQYLRQPRFLIP
jgi:hypothetical protein